MSNMSDQAGAALERHGLGLSYVSFFVSHGKKGDDKAQSDRWGIFNGHWAPTLFALGIALRLEEANL